MKLRRRRFTSAGVSLVLLFVGGVGQAIAARNNPILQLEFSPQQTVGAPTIDLAPGIGLRAVRLRLEDGRKAEDPRAIGTRSDDDDRVHRLLASADPSQFIEATLTRLAGEWGVRIAADAPLALEARWTRFQVTERNLAVGATFEAEVRLTVDLRRGEQILWRGSAIGDASRYGKKYSNPNCNEVLSDALLEAWAAVLSDVGLHEAWLQDVAVAPGRAAEPLTEVSPEKLLAEIMMLIEEGVTAETIATFVGNKSLTRALAANDIVEWKARGVPEIVVRSAVGLPVR